MFQPIDPSMRRPQPLEPAAAGASEPSGSRAAAPIAHASGQPQAGRPVAAARCPICGTPNGCAMVRCGGGAHLGDGTSGVTCWCMNVTFAPALLARVPQPAQRVACICRACVQRAAGEPADRIAPPSTRAG